MSEYNYNFLNMINSTSPVPLTVHVNNTQLAFHFRRYLFQQAVSRFKINIPDYWDKDYFIENLFGNGHLGVFWAPEFGVLPQVGSLTGWNVFYRPKKYMIANPAIQGGQTQELEIGKDCELIYFQSDFGGIMDLVSLYADAMALTFESMLGNINNCKLAYVFCAANKADAESFKRLMDDILGGKPAVVVDPKLFDEQGNLKMQFFNQNVTATYIAPELSQQLKQLELDFCNKIGIPNSGASATKSQYQSNQNLETESQQSMCLCQLWMEKLKACFEKVNKMFGLDLSIELRDFKEGLKEEEPKEEDEDIYVLE